MTQPKATAESSTSPGVAVRGSGAVAGAKAAPTAGAPSGKGRFWMFLPLLLLGASVAGWVVMVRLAVNDPTFAVEPDYYRKASRYEEVQRARVQSEKLGWQARVERFTFVEGQLLLSVALADSAGVPISGAVVQVEAVSNLRAARPETLVLAPGAAGLYEGRMNSRAPGLWELRLRAERGAEVFTQVLRAELGQGGPRP